MFKKVISSVGAVVAAVVMSTTVWAQDLLISGGYEYSTAICANGQVYSWGINQQGTPPISGSLGIGSTSTPVTTPQRVLYPTNDPYFFGVLGLTNVTIRQVDAGSTGTLMSLDCHTGVWTVGLNNNSTGILGQGPSLGAASTVPARVLRGEYTGPSYHPSLSSFLTNVRYITGGDNMNYVIINGTGEVMSWGLNANGQLGNGSTVTSSLPVYVRTNATTRLTNAIQIEAGDRTGYALIDPDGDGIGTVYSWGAGDVNQLGRSAIGGTNSTTENGNDSYAKPVVFPNGAPLDNIVSISAGDVMCYALDVNGYVWAWGNHGWGGLCGTGPGGGHSDPKRVLAGQWATTPGNAGETYLRARSIAGGQGFGMAVSVDGIPLAWGNNNFTNGSLGNGGAADSNVPVIIRTSAGTYDNDVISISDGDSWGFYTRENGTLRTWGLNTRGQLGIGNTTNQPYAVSFTLPGGCAIPDPRPYANISPRDQVVCLNTWSGSLLNSQFSVSGALASNYTIVWERNGTPIAGATNPTYNATQLGTYRVTVTYIGSSVPCATYAPATDEITISEAIAPYTANTGTYCGATGTFSVTGYTGNTNRFQWFTNATGGTALTITPATTPANTSNTITTALTNATMVNATTYRLWAEDSWALDNHAAPTPPCTTNDQVEPGNAGSANIATAFILNETNGIIMESMDVTIRGYGNGTATYRVSIVPDNGSNSPNFATNLLQTPILTADVTASPVRTTIPLNFNLSTLTPGTKYWIRIAVVSGQMPLMDFTQGCPASPLPLVDNSGKNILSVTNSFRYSTVNTRFPAMYNFNITRGNYYPCRRIPVDITEDCPPCAKPTAVTITAPATTPLTLCQGTAQTLSGTATVAAASQNGGFRYFWFKQGTALPLATGTVVIPVSTATAVPNYTGITGLVADAGTYILRVEDGNAGSATCYTEASVVINVNPTTTPGVVAGDQTICTGGNPAAFTVTTAAGGGNGTTYTYQWEQSTNGGTSWTDIATSGTSATYDPPVLTNATTANTTVLYRRKVTSGVCPQVTSNTITVTVNPAIVAGVVAADQTICNGGDPAAFTVTTAPTGGTGTYTYQWQSATALAGPYANIASATAATYDAPTGISATTYYRRVDASGTCSTINTNVITVTVPTALVAGTIGTAQTICYNSIPAAFTSTAAASGGVGPYNYQWQSSTDNVTFNDIAGETSATFTPTTALTANTYYRRRVTSGNPAGCNTGQTASILITVSANLTAGAVAGDQTICNGSTPAAFTSTTAAAGGQTPYTYLWQSSPDGGTTWNPLPSSNSTTYTMTTPIANTGTTPITVLIRRAVTSSGSCGTVQTTPLTITVNPTLVPDISIAANNSTICAGTSITFTSTPTNPGTTPTYQWRRNGTNIAGATNANYTTTSAVNNDSYTVVMTSNATCVSPTSITSNAVVITVTTVVTPTVTLAADKTSICPSETVTFTATPGNGGPSPTFEFFVGGVSQGAASTVATFLSSTLTNGASVTVQMVSNSGCASTPNASSSPVVIAVASTITPSVSVAANPGTSICSGQAVTYTLTPSNQGSAIPSYQWRVDGTIQAGQTSTSFSPSTIGNNAVVSVDMTVVAISGTYCPTSTTVSGSVTMTVSPPVTAGTIGGATSVCSGTGASLTQTPPTGGSGTYTYQWQQATSATGPWTNISGATDAAYTAGSLTATTYFQRIDGSGSCATQTTNNVAITVLPGIIPGTISIADNSICYNTVPGVISTGIAPAGGTGTYSLSWESSTDGTTWSPIAGETGTSLSYSTALTADIQFRKVINDGSTGGCNIAYTPAISIDVFDPFTAGTIGSDQVACEAATLNPFTELTAPAGGDASYTYRWQYSEDGGSTWSPNISGATTNIYNPGSLTTSRVYRRLVSSGCGTNLESNIVTVTINPNLPVSIVLDDPGAACAGSAIAFNATAFNPGTTPTYIWTVNGVNQSNNAASFTSSALSNGDRIQVQVISSEQCKTGSPATSNEVIVSITSSVTPAVSITDPGPICVGGAAFFQATPTSGGATPSYLWMVNGNPVGSDQDTYLDGALNNGDQVSVLMTSSFACAVPSAATSNIITMIVRPVPAPTITGRDTTLCSGQSVVFTANTTPGNAIRWNLNGGPMSGQTNPSITITSAGTYTVTENNGACAITSAPYVVNVIQTPIAYAGVDQVVLENDLVTLTGSGGTNYTWSPAAGLNNPNIPNPTFSAVQTTTYTLTVSDATNRCSSTDEVTIIVERPIRIPNAITVNGDGQNDVWDIENMNSFPNAIVEVYNRWGTLVWKSVGYDKMWDGTNYRNGEVLPDGTYFYIIILNSTKFPDPYKGYIQVIR